MPRSKHTGPVHRSDKSPAGRAPRQLRKSTSEEPMSEGSIPSSIRPVQPHADKGITQINPDASVVPVTPNKELTTVVSDRVGSLMLETSLPSSTSTLDILEVSHEVARQKLLEDFAGSTLLSSTRQGNHERQALARVKTLVEASGLQPHPFTAWNGWTFPGVPAALKLHRGTDDESILKDLQELADRCRESYSRARLSEKQSKIIVNFDCLTVGCIATMLSLAVNRKLPIHLDYDYTYGTEQIYRLNKHSDADILITVDGSFALVGANTYRFVTPVHKENQCRIVVLPERKPRGASLPNLHYVERSSFEEQFIFGGKSEPAHPCPAADLDEFIEDMTRNVLPGDQFIYPQAPVLQVMRRHPSRLAIRDEYQNFVSMSFHHRWFDGETLAPCMQELLNLFVREWNYLRTDLSQASELLFRDYPGVGYKVKTLLAQLSYLTSAATSLAANVTSSFGPEPISRPGLLEVKGQYAGIRDKINAFVSHKRERGVKLLRHLVCVWLRGSYEKAYKELGYSQADGLWKSIRSLEDALDIVLILSSGNKKAGLCFTPEGIAVAMLAEPIVKQSPAHIS